MIISRAAETDGMVLILFSSRHLFLFDYKNEQLSIGGTDLLENEYYDGILPPFGGSDQIVFSPDNKKIIYSCKRKKYKARKKTN